MTDGGGVMEAFEIQNEIIRLQSEAIDELFRVLCQYVSFKDGECQRVVDKINEAATARRELGF